MMLLCVFAMMTSLIVIDVVVAQIMSVSLTSSASQLFCYAVPPPLSSPLRCAYSQQIAALSSMAIVTSAAPWSARHDANLIVFPHPLAFNHTNGSTIHLPSQSLVIIGGQSQSQAAPLLSGDGDARSERTSANSSLPSSNSNDVWISGDVGAR